MKLRDVMQCFDVGVGWDGTGNTIILDTSIAYGAVPTSPMRLLFAEHLIQEGDNIMGFIIQSDTADMRGNITNFSFTRDGQSIVDIEDVLPPVITTTYGSPVPHYI